MSVNNTVRRARWDCGGAAWLPVRNSSIPVRIRVRLGEPGCVVRAVDLEVPRARDVVGEIPAALHWHAGVVAGVDNEGGRGERRQDRPEVDPEHRFHCRSRHARACAHALERGELTYRPGRRGHKTLSCRTAAPRRADGAAEFLSAGDLLHRQPVLIDLGYILAQLGKLG